jgi:hypothetical protein
MKDAVGKPVFRLETTPDAAITFTVKGAAKPAVTTSLRQLAAGPVTVNTDKGVIRLEMALDAVELNVDRPLPGQGEKYVRTVPINTHEDATRYFHAWALTASDKVAYSRPIAVTKIPPANAGCVIDQPETPVPCRFIHTRGIFDDFVDSSSSAARNFFTAKDIVNTTFPARLIPYYLYDFEEGCGTMLNDGGTAHQCGRAWLSPTGCTWIKDGWRGSAIRLHGGTIDLRAKSWPHGEYTFSARVRLAEPSTAPAPLAGDGDHWLGLTTQGLRIDLLPDGRIKAVRQIRDCEGTVTSTAKLGPGWNHLVVTHDLEKLRIFINGKPAGEAPVKAPGYMRTHSTPKLAFSQAAQSVEPGKTVRFTGDLDQVEIIGTALTPQSVSDLYRKGQWLAR